jgi:AcrR family transcriptional regulator
MAQGKRSAARKINIEERRHEALELRKHGLSMREIAKRLGVGVATIHEDIRQALASAIAENVKEAESLRTLEIERLDMYLSSMEKKLREGDTAAITVALRIAEQRAKLLGLNAPERREITGDNGGAVENRVAIDFSKMNRQELREFIQALKS